MSAESFLVFYGCRQAVEDDEIDLLERRTHPTFVAARKAGLEIYWGNFSYTGTDQFFLFIGKKIGIFGWENQKAAVLTKEEFLAIASTVESKLASLQLTAGIGLHSVWQPDLP